MPAWHGGLNFAAIARISSQNLPGRRKTLFNGLVKQAMDGLREHQSR
jgi:hypothetical protein